jgi:hypothetical protein
MNRKQKWNYQKAVRVAKAERHVIRCAMGIVNIEGWAFQQDGEKGIVIFPTALRRLEDAIASLKEARKHRPARASASTRSTQKGE